MEERTIETCAFTGHRTIEEDFSFSALSEAIDECIRLGCKKFYCGMALGFDMLAAEEVLKRKEKNGELVLIACVPCLEQTKFFPYEEKKRYEKILKKADETVVISERYTPWCMAKRNEYMADRADALIAYCHKTKGGSAYTLNYFQKKKDGLVFKI